VESSGQKVAIEAGAHLHLSVGEYARLSFSITDGSNVLCTAVPGIRNVGAAKRPQGPGLSNALALLPIHIIGDPVLASAPLETRIEDDFRIGGRIMRPLFRNGRLVLLRDPNPVTGVRIIQSPLGAAMSLFLTVAITPQQIDMRSPAQSVSVSIAGLEELRYPIDLYLFNTRRDRFQLNCGLRSRNSSSRKADGIEMRVLPIRPNAVHNGKFETACAVRVLQSGETPLWAAIDSSVLARKINPDRPF
jgi:hypothetical protein